MGKLPIHGRDHRPGGSDPLGEWYLHWGSNEDTHGLGLYADTAHLIHIISTNEIELETPFLFLQGDGTSPARIYSFTLLDVQCDSINLTGNGGGIALADFSGGDITTDGGSLLVTLRTGKKLRVLDNGGNPIFEVREDGTVHIKTGGTIQADL